MPGSAPAYVTAAADRVLGPMYPGGVFQIVANTLASPTIVSTVAPHGLQTGDTVFWTASAVSVPLLTASPQTAIIVLSSTTFSLVGINCSTAGTSGAYDYAILSIPATGVGVPATVNVGCACNVRVGDTVTIVASGSTPSLDGAQVVTAVGADGRSFQVGAVTNVTVAGSTTAAHFTKTIFYSDVIDRTWFNGPGGLSLTSLISTAPNTTLIDIQGSFDGQAWFNLAYATMAAPQTALYAQLTVTTSTTTNYKLWGGGENGGIPWRYLRLKFTSSTNITISAAVHLKPGAGL